MEESKRPCSRGDLRAAVSGLSLWHVDEDGETSKFDTDGDYEGLGHYVCGNCGACFVPDDGSLLPALERAWQEALDHVARKGVA
jgi:hypothetical protein